MDAVLNCDTTFHIDRMHNDYSCVPPLLLRLTALVLVFLFATSISFSFSSKRLPAASASENCYTHDCFYFFHSVEPAFIHHAFFSFLVFASYFKSCSAFVMRPPMDETLKCKLSMFLFCSRSATNA